MVSCVVPCRTVSARLNTGPSLHSICIGLESAARAASFKSLYRKRANTPRSWSRLAHRASDTTLGLIVTYLDRDMEFVLTPKHLDKMSWHRSSSVKIQPLQPTNSFFSANPATIRIDSLDFQSGRRSKREIVSESPSSERRLLWATS